MAERRLPSCYRPPLTTCTCVNLREQGQVCGGGRLAYCLKYAGMIGLRCADVKRILRTSDSRRLACEPYGSVQAPQDGSRLVLRRRRPPARLSTGKQHCWERLRRAKGGCTTKLSAAFGSRGRGLNLARQPPRDAAMPEPEEPLSRREQIIMAEEAALLGRVRRVLGGRREPGGRRATRPARPAGTGRSGGTALDCCYGSSTSSGRPCCMWVNVRRASRDGHRVGRACPPRGGWWHPPVGGQVSPPKHRLKLKPYSLLPTQNTV